jgi:cell division protein FtsW (lipid II flippase)
MSRNPYSPPEAPVSTPEEPLRERPKQIVWASWLLWASVLLGFLSLYVSDDLSRSMEDMDEEMQSYMRIFLIVFMAVSVAVYLWCIDRMRAGRNWARVVLLVFLLLGVTTELMPGEFERSALYIATRAIDMVLQVTAMVLMFKPPGSDWFSAQR